MRRSLAAAMFICGTFGIYGANNSSGTTVSVLVTVKSKEANPFPLSKDNLMVKEDRDVRQIVDVRQADGSSSQVLLMLDDSAGGTFDSQISELKKFVLALPANAEVGVCYMRNGFCQTVSGFTPDHAKAAAALRLSEGRGGADVSPYDSLTYAVKNWPAQDAMTRREVVMITSGIEGLGGGFPPDNPYVNAGIASAIKGGVTVYAIYNPAFGHVGRGLWQATEGQNFLSQVTEETGGEFYQIGLGSAVSFEPFLADILKHQSEQYILTFDARAEKKSGLQEVKIQTKQKGLSLEAPEKVYVKAGL